MSTEELHLQPAGGTARASDDKQVILAVDDEAMILLCLADMLEDLGYSAIQCRSGADALAMLSTQSRVDLLLTDLSMPNMTGLELATAAKNLRPDLPVLLATGYGETQFGVDDGLPRLAKPYSQDQLGAAILRLLPH